MYICRIRHLLRPPLKPLGTSRGSANGSRPQEEFKSNPHKRITSTSFYAKTMAPSLKRKARRTAATRNDTQVLRSPASNRQQPTYAMSWTHAVPALGKRTLPRSPTHVEVALQQPFHTVQVGSYRQYHRSDLELLAERRKFRTLLPPATSPKSVRSIPIPACVPVSHGSSTEL